MSKSSFTLGKIEDGINGNLPHRQQKKFYEGYMNDAEQQQAIDALLEFKRLYGDATDLRTETLKAEWLKKITIFLLLATTLWTMLLPLYNPDPGINLITCKTEYTSPILLPQINPDNNYRTGISSATDSLVIDSPDDRNTRNTDIRLYSKADIGAINTGKHCNAGIVNTQKTSFERSEKSSEIGKTDKTVLDNTENRYADIRENRSDGLNLCQENKYIFISTDMGGSRCRTDLLPVITLPDNIPVITIDDIESNIKIIVNDTGVSSFAPELDNQAPDPYVIRLLLSTFR